jgi:hypothetical protein
MKYSILENMVVEEMSIKRKVSTLFLVFKTCNVLIYNVLIKSPDSFFSVIYRLKRIGTFCYKAIIQHIKSVKIKKKCRNFLKKM